MRSDAHSTLAVIYLLTYLLTYLITNLHFVTVGKLFVNDNLRTIK